MSGIGGGGGVTQAQILSDATPFAGGNVDVKASSMQRTLLASIAATVQKLILEQKAAMDETTFSSLSKSANNYVIFPNNISLISGFSDLTAYTKTDPNSHLTVNSATKVTAAGLAGSESAYLRKDGGAANINDFDMEFDFQITANNGGSGACNLVAISDDAVDNNGYVGTNSVSVRYVPVGNNIQLIYQVSTQLGSSYAISLSTQYYCKFYRSNNRTRLEIRTGSQTGTLVASMEGTTDSTVYRYVSVFYSNNNATYTLSGDIDNVGFAALTGATSGNVKSAAIAKDANIGLRYWGDIVANLVAGAAGSTIAMKILDSTGTPLHTNFVTIASSEYSRIPLERPVVLTATSGSQTVWNFTSLSNANAFINELGVLAKALLVELALDGTNYTVLKEVTDYTEDISNIKAPKITLVSGAGVISGSSKLRITYIVNIALNNTTIKVQIQLNRTAGGDTSPSIQPFVGDATKYVSAGQVAII